MMRTMVYLPEALHKAIKHLAVERGTSFAKLVQEALESLYREDLDDLKSGRDRLKEYLKNPENVMSYAEYRSKRAKR